MALLEVINFPAAPTVNELFATTDGTTVWRYDGEKWVVAPSGATGPPLIVTVTTALGVGFGGFVWAEPASGPITITLPPTPLPGQAITIKNTSGNAAARPITIAGSSETIEGVATFVLEVDYGWAPLVYTGSEWVQI